MGAKSKLAKWLKENVEFLKENDNYSGCWIRLDGGILGVTITWEDGFDADDESVIHSKTEPSWAMVAGIKVINENDTCEFWNSPSDDETGDIICETTTVSPKEDFENLAQYLLDSYDEVKDFEINPDGTLNYNEPNSELDLDNIEELSKAEGDEEEKDSSSVED